MHLSDCSFRCRPRLGVSACLRRCTIGCILIGLVLFLYAPLPGEEPLVVDTDQQEVRVSATVNITGFQGWWTRLTGIPGYHLLVWHQGHAAENALFVTAVSDVILHEALTSIGAVPGDALGMNAWKERDNPRSNAPDGIVQGAPIDLSVIWEGLEKAIPIADLLEDPGGHGIEFRFAGHLVNAPIWRSGCGVCLYSCPGSKVGNAAYTVRDYVNETTTFRVRERLLPKPGTPLWLIFTLGNPKK